MRAVKNILWWFVLLGLVVCPPARLQAASPADLIRKDVIVYVDRSQSIVSEHAESPHKKIAEGLGKLFAPSEADGHAFLGSQDRIFLYTFSDSVRTELNGVEAGSTDVWNNYLTSFAASVGSKEDAITDFAPVALHMEQFETDHPDTLKVFIVASDFVNDLKNRVCEVLKHEGTTVSEMDKVAARISGKFFPPEGQGTPPSDFLVLLDVEPRLDIYSAQDRQRCLQAVRRAATIKNAMVKGFTGRVFQFQDLKKNADSLLRYVLQTITQPLLLREAGDLVLDEAEKSVKGFWLKVVNPNPFPVEVVKAFVGTDGRNITESIDIKPTRITPRSEGTPLEVMLGPNIIRDLRLAKEFFVQVDQTPSPLVGQGRSNALRVSMPTATAKIEEAFLGRKPGKNPTIILETRIKVVSDSEGEVRGTLSLWKKGENHPVQEWEVAIPMTGKSTQVTDKKLIDNPQEVQSISRGIFGTRDGYETKLTMEKGGTAILDAPENPIYWMKYYVPMACAVLFFVLLFIPGLPKPRWADWANLLQMLPSVVAGLLIVFEQLEVDGVYSWISRPTLFVGSWLVLTVLFNMNIQKKAAASMETDEYIPFHVGMFRHLMLYQVIAVVMALFFTKVVWSWIAVNP